MWQLDNRTPFAAERTWVRDRDGTETWLVAVKASFDIQPDSSLVVAPAQPPVTLVPQYMGKPGFSSLRMDTDLPRTKTTTDVIVLGQAHAPGGRPVQSLDIGVGVGMTTKVLRVFGNRRWHGKRISDPEPFVAMPLNYERAFGGIDPMDDRAWDVRNPVGKGFATRAPHLDGTALPNFEDPSALIEHWDDRPEPAGLGPLSSHWHARQQWAGTCDERWQRERAPLLPEDFDDRHYQCAPPGLQAPQFLRGGEPVALMNLSPGGGNLRFVLPRLFLSFETEFFTGPGVRHEPPKLHTVILEPELARVALVWHSALACHPRVLKLKATVIGLKQDLRAGVLAVATEEGAPA